MVWRARLRQAIDATDKGDKAIAAEAGIAAETLSRLLRSDQEPGLETMRRLASATGVSVGWLLGEEPFSRADDERLRDIISYLEPKKVPESPRIESNAVAVRDAAPQAITRRKPRPAQATPDVEQEPEGAAVRPLRQGGEDRVPYRAQGDSQSSTAISCTSERYDREMTLKGKSSSAKSMDRSTSNDTFSATAGRNCTAKTAHIHR